MNDEMQERVDKAQRLFAAHKRHEDESRMLALKYIHQMTGCLAAYEGGSDRAAVAAARKLIAEYAEQEEAIRAEYYAILYADTDGEPA